MKNTTQIAEEHESLTRRHFLLLSAAGAAGLSLPAYGADKRNNALSLEEAIAKLEYLTLDEDFTFFGRVDPKPHQLSPERLKEEGLTRDSWKLEVLPDPSSDTGVKFPSSTGGRKRKAPDPKSMLPVVENPLSKALGTAFTWGDLMGLAETKAVRIMKVMTCTNGGKPCGMGLWEGVPLRDVIWLAKPKSNIRRVIYYGFHNDEPKQIFQGSLPIGRVLEDPPDDHPVLLCYKMNEEWLSLKRGGPVRIIVPEGYGNKNVKWIDTVILTNNHKANDTYANWNNDTASQMKTCARFIHKPKSVKSGAPIPVTGIAQIGMSGLEKVQYLLLPKEAPKPSDDPYYIQSDWKDAEILSPPKDWGGGLAGGKITDTPIQFDQKTGKPSDWPIRYTIAHWAVAIPGIKAGKYDLRCRTIDANGVAQPMPRPFNKSGNNKIARVSITVEA
ncbi:molybdopterin-dependent oxidoreductase [Candidatus Hydrogenedentota bacterium]